MQPAPYTVTNRYKGYVTLLKVQDQADNQFRGLFMRTYARNVRRAWDGDCYFYSQSQHNYVPARKRLCIENLSTNPTITLNHAHAHAHTHTHTHNENDPEDTLERAIRATSVAMSSSPSRKNSTVFS